MDFDYCEEITLYQTKCYYGIVKKNKFSFSCHLQIDKKINVKKDTRRKTLIFPKLPNAYEVLTRRNVM